MVIEFFFNSNEPSLAQIDPVELLTVVIKQMDAQELDQQDLAGFTPLHYAAVRGSTIACTLLIANQCSILRKDNCGNTPLSSAIYFKRETCVLTLLRSGLVEASGGANAFSLSSSYNLQERDLDSSVTTAVKEGWTLKRDVEKELYPEKKLSLYKLILAHGWEGKAFFFILD